MKKEKEQALNEFMKMIHQSWTYARFTEEEKEAFNNMMFGDFSIKLSIKGSFNNRWETLQAIYSSYLIALGYQSSDMPCKEWRG